MAEDTLDAKRLRKILEKLGEPGSLADDPFLQSWIVQDYIDANPDATEYPAGVHAKVVRENEPGVR